MNGWGPGVFGLVGPGVSRIRGGITTFCGWSGENGFVFEVQR